jgi:hypothetical protein
MPQGQFPQEDIGYNVSLHRSQQPLQQFHPSRKFQRS